MGLTDEDATSPPRRYRNPGTDRETTAVAIYKMLTINSATIDEYVCIVWKSNRSRKSERK